MHTVLSYVVYYSFIRLLRDLQLKADDSKRLLEKQKVIIMGNTAE